jgi:hypothetical protein
VIRGRGAVRLDGGTGVRALPEQDLDPTRLAEIAARLDTTTPGREYAVADLERELLAAYQEWVAMGYRVRHLRCAITALKNLSGQESASVSVAPRGALGGGAPQERTP